MNLFTRCTVTFVAISLLAGQSVEAQNPQIRDGLWFNVGFGVGSLGCSDCDGRESGLGGGLALGGTLSDKVQLGVFSNWWTKSEDGVTLSAGSLTGAIRFYPSATGGFFLVGGLGLGILRASLFDPGFDPGSFSETGFAAILGLGYDIRVGRMLSLTPFWNGIGMSFDGGDVNFGQLGLGLTIH